MYSFRLKILVFLCVLGALACRAEKYAPLPPALDGSMMPYDFSASTLSPSLPDTLKPVYAAYVARHGARYLSGPAKLAALRKALEKGRNTGTLSATGEALLRLTDTIRVASEGNWGDLSPIGIAEEKKLGERMFKMLPPLAVSGARVKGVSSFMPRVVMTMYQFTARLCRLNDQITISTDEGPQFDPLLCCFMADKEYAAFRKDGAWVADYDNFVEKHVSVHPARNLFTTTDLTTTELRKLTMEMYEVLKSNRAAGLPAPTTRWMSAQEYQECWRADNLKHYLRNSITPLSELAGSATVPLLEKIIEDADNSLSQLWLDQVVLNGYFGHCETLLPLISLMDLPVCTMPDYINYENLDRCWKIQELSPLGANLIMLYAAAPSGRIYVMLQLNGRPIRGIRGEPEILPWETLRVFWKARIKEYSR